MSGNSTSESSQKNVEKLKRYGKSKGLIKSPMYNDPRTNPCIKEQNATVKCGLENDFNKNLCRRFYDNYTICMKFWNWIEWERKIEGIYPALPPPEERGKILEDRMSELRTSESLKAGIFRGIFNT